MLCQGRRHCFWDIQEETPTKFGRTFVKNCGTADEDLRTDQSRSWTQHEIIYIVSREFQGEFYVESDTKPHRVAHIISYAPASSIRTQHFATTTSRLHQLRPANTCLPSAKTGARLGWWIVGVAAASQLGDTVRYARYDFRRGGGGSDWVFRRVCKKV
jgi:hypothetical protein